MLKNYFKQAYNYEACCTLTGTIFFMRTSFVGNGESTNYTVNSIQVMQYPPKETFRVNVFMLDRV